MKPVMLKTTLSMAVVAVFTVACSSTPRYQSSAAVMQPEVIYQQPENSYVGPLGATGDTGAQGMDSSTGAMGMAAPSWNYTFNGNRDDISDTDTGKAQEIASYMRQNPSSRVMLNGPGGRYVHSVAEVLRDAGVPASKIQTGAFTDPNLNNGHRVDVMVSY